MSEKLNVFKCNKNLLKYNETDRSLVIEEHKKACYKLRYLPSKNHTQVKPKTFACCLCKNVFSDKSCFNSHIRIHEEEKNFSCSINQKQFLTWNEMKEHLEIYSSLHFICSICQCTLNSQETLDKHHNIHTRREQKVKIICDICKKMFSTKQNLKHHLRIHNGENPYKCNVCDAQFSLKTKLHCHLLKHTGKRPFKCDFCKKDFSLLGTFKRHLRIHTGERPFSCEKCHKAFSQKRDALAHRCKHKK